MWLFAILLLRRGVSALFSADGSWLTSFALVSVLVLSVYESLMRFVIFSLAVGETEN